MSEAPKDVPPRGPHDLGGERAGAVPQDGHELAWWEKRIDALLSLLGDERRNLISTEELRRAIESLGEDAYDRHGYYERWTLAIADLLLEKGVLEQTELAQRMARIAGEHGRETG